MDNNPSPKADKTPEASPDAPFTRFIELDGRSPVPSQFRTAGLEPPAQPQDMPSMLGVGPISHVLAARRLPPCKLASCLRAGQSIALTSSVSIDETSSRRSVNRVLEIQRFFSMAVYVRSPCAQSRHGVVVSHGACNLEPQSGSAQWPLPSTPSSVHNAAGPGGLYHNDATRGSSLRAAG